MRNAEVRSDAPPSTPENAVTALMNAEDPFSRLKSPYKSNKTPRAPLISEKIKKWALPSRMD